MSLFLTDISTRTKQIGSVIQRALAPLLIPFEQEHGLATIAEVRVMEDLSEARVYVFAQRSMTRLVEQLNARAGILGREISSKLTQKKTPRLRFFPDETELAARRIEELLGE